MKRSKFDENRDQRTADEYGTGPDKQMMCTAHNCPNLWSTSDGNVCRWHAAAPPHRWPEVTQDLQDATTNRVIDAQRLPQQVAPVSQTERRAILNRLRTAMTQPRDPRAWIGVLLANEGRGERLSAMQKHCLASVRSPEAL